MGYLKINVEDYISYDSFWISYGSSWFGEKKRTWEIKKKERVRIFCFSGLVQAQFLGLN